MSYEFAPVSGAPQAVPGRRLGVVAQEVEAVFPELVSLYGVRGYKAVDYSGLTGVLLEAVKELRRENGSLRRRMALLEAGRDARAGD